MRAKTIKKKNKIPKLPLLFCLFSFGCIWAYLYLPMFNPQEPTSGEDNRYINKEVTEEWAFSKSSYEKNYSYKTSKQKQISIIGYIKGNCNYNDHNCTQQTFFNEKYGWSASAYQLWSDGMSDILSCIRHCIVLFLDKSVKKI